MDTSIDLSILPCEVRQYIWSYCDKPSLKVLSVCCKWFYAEVKPFIWKRVDLSWQFLEGVTKEFIKNADLNLQLISCLILGVSKVSSPTDPDPSCGKLSFGLVRFLDRCERLKSLTISHILPADGLYLVCESLPQLEKLELSGITLRAGDLEPFLGLLQLKSLLLRQCSIQKSDCDIIWQLESLEHLTLTHSTPPGFCDNIPRGGFRLKNLLSLQFLETVESVELYSCIAKTSVKLENLRLPWSSIQDSDMLKLTRLPRLKYVSLFGADQISDLGISYLSNLSCLERLEISACERLSPHCLADIGKIQTLRCLDLDQFSEHATNISYLSHLVNLHSLVISSMPGLTDSALKVVAQFKKLRKLDIRENDNFTEEGIRHLAQLPLLRTLEVDSKNISDEVLRRHGLLGKVPK